MHTEIENLINMALADGEVPEKERIIILRKAESLGLDLDEVEMILEGRITLHNKNSNVLETSLSNKEGVVRKCPSCGSAVQSFISKCIDCGHEFRGTDSVSSIKALYSELQKVEETERNRPRSWLDKIDGELAVAKSIANHQKTIISSFPVPNTKEDLLEFLSVASGEATKKLGLFIAAVHPDAVLKNAWKAKCDQLINKSRLTFRDDKITLGEIEKFAKQLGIK